MSSIRVSYLGLVRNMVGKSEEEVAFEGTTVRELLDLLCARHGDSFRDSIFATGGQLRSIATVLLDGRNVQDMGGLEAPIGDEAETCTLIVVYPMAGGAEVKDDAWVPTVCNMCFNCCGIRAHRVNGVVVKLEGDPDNPHNRGKICAKGQAGLMGLYNPHRVTKPLKRTNPEKGIGVDPRWVETTWEEALDTLVERLRKIRAEDPRKLVISNFDLHTKPAMKAWAAAFGTPNTWNGASGYFCGNGYHPVTFLTHGTYYSEPDLDYCNYCILIGDQNGFVGNHNPMALTQKMADARLRGMKLVVVDPVCSNAAAKADEWLPIRPGTDAAFALSLLHVLLNELGCYDADFLRRRTNAAYLVGGDGHYLRDGQTQRPLVWDLHQQKAGAFDAVAAEDMALESSYQVEGIPCKPAFQLLKEHVQEYTPEWVSGITTLPAETIRRIACEFGAAARIGSTIMLEGKELPYRPALVDWNRGPTAHKHGLHAGIAIQLINMVVGAMDVPGGHLGINPVGPFWAPREGPDGLLVPGDVVSGGLLPYPAARPRPPATLEINELFPTAYSTRPLFVINALHPETFQVPYQPKLMIHCHSNLMMSTADPEAMAEVLRRIPFMVSFAITINETVEFADIILPEAHFLESLEPFPNHPFGFIVAGEGSWYWTFTQPVVEPPPGVRHWIEVLYELADRVGFREDLYVILNNLPFPPLREPYKLDPSQNYTWEELCDRWAKSLLGPERGLDSFRAHGVLISRPKKVEEAYPGPFLKPRIPLYLEHLLEAAEGVQRATEALGIPWDTSDYQPLPPWRPCPAYERDGDFDLLAVNYKVPFHTFSFSVGNPWLNELAERNPYAYNILMNSAVGRQKGIRDGERVWLETAQGSRISGRVRLTEGVHPEVVGVAGTFGHWAQGEPVARGKGLHFNRLLPYTLDRVDLLSACLDSCIRVRVTKG